MVRQENGMMNVLVLFLLADTKNDMKIQYLGLCSKKMKKYSYIFYYFLLLVSCENTDKQNTIDIDLSKTDSCIAYSMFVKSVENLDLHITDGLPITGVERLYFDESKIFVKDSGREGILVFDKGSGNLLKRVNPFGEGPEEIKRISSFCLDTYHKKICIFDQSDMKVKMYDFSGKYASSYPTDMFFIDMAKLDKNSMTYFYPIYAEEQFYGIWSSDSLNQLKKQVSSHVTKECMFHYFPMLYNMNDTCVYYYDRNWDEISVVTSDSIQTLYSLGVKQRIPLFKKGIRDITPQELDGYAILHNFACSNNFILCSFHTFDKNDIRKKNITWVLLDTRTGKVTISKKLKNDLMAEDEIENNSLFYMNNYTWLRVDDSFEDLIRLKILHLQ